MIKGKRYKVLVGSHYVGNNLDQEIDIEFDKLMSEGYEPYTNLTIDNVYDFKNERYVFQYYQVFIMRTSKDKEQDPPF